MGRVQKGSSIVAVLVTMTGLVAGCGSGQTSNQGTTTSTSSGSQNQVVDYSKASGSIVWAAPPITHNGLRATLIKQFEKEHPNIKVTLQDQSSDTDTNRASLTTAIGGGASSPDVYMGDVVWPAQFAHSQLAKPISDVLPSSFFNRFSPGLVNGATYQSKVYAAPFFADSAFLFYRKDLLQQANLPVPTSWEQVKDEAQQLQKKGLVQYGFVWQGASYEGLTCDFGEYLKDAGGKVLDDQGKAAIQSPEATKALTFMRGLITSGVSPQAEVTFQEPQSEDTFVQGKAAFIRNWSYAWPDSQNAKTSKVAGKVGVTVLPTFGGGGGYSTVGGWDLFVNPHSKNIAADLAFIDWMTGTEAQTILSKQFSEISTNQSVVSDPSVENMSPVFKIIGETHYVSRPNQTPDYPKISQAIYSSINAALAGSMSVEDALKQAQQQISQALSSNGSL